jgi:peptidoglycan/xylan/chitin deacetylase (PgdA/CDA1 family)
MAITSNRIKEATGFRPCLFRPPYGAYDSRVVSDARSLGMTTVNWDVDPTDWTTPGSEAIYQRVVSHVQPGSIVLMHDGGGNRSQTVAALPRIIQNLKGRGYHFSTVSQMLGQRTIWEPVSRKAVKRRRAISRDTRSMRRSQFEPPERFRVADTHGLGRE